MGCFSLGWIQQLLVWLVIIVAIVALIRLFVPWLLAQLGAGGMIVQAINIVLWAVVTIFVIYFVFALISCLLSMGGGGLPLFPHR